MTTKLQRSKRRLLFGFGISLLILIGSSILSYYSIMQLLDSQSWVSHTAQVEAGLQNMVSRMKDAETGQRGFLLSGENVFLEPYTNAEEDIRIILNELQLLTSDNQQQQNDFPLMEKMVREKFAVIEKTISDRKRGIPPAVNTLYRGKSIMDSIRVLTKTMLAREKKLMISRDAKMNMFVRYTPIVIGIAALIALLITLIFYFKIDSEVKASFQLQVALEEQQRKKERQIEVIGNVAEKIAGGDYKVRIQEADLE
jgi:CHASE3 domain sensor protein